VAGLKTWAVVLLGLCLGLAVQAQPFNAATYNLRFNTASDGPNAWPLPMMKELLETLKEIDALVKQRGFIEHIIMQA
jgi:3-deoxy-D-manno-octulosonic acid (KDO) 8-phosphate synthase